MFELFINGGMEMGMLRSEMIMIYDEFYKLFLQYCMTII